MSQKTLAEHAGVMASEISKNPEDWEKRRDALVHMQQAVEEIGLSGQAGSIFFTADVWRVLKEPLKNTLHDLRSAIVKEACHLLEKLSTVAGNLMAALMRDMLTVLLQLMANGNSVIVAQVDSCMKHVIRHTRFPRQLKEIEYRVRNSRSKDLRESVGSYVLLMLSTWPAASMDKDAQHLENIISLLLADASNTARIDARASFGIFRTHWPKRADRILQAADPRTAKTLNEEFGGSLSSSGVSTTPGGGGVGGGGVLRLSTKSHQSKGGATRRGPASVDPLRVPVDGSTVGNGQGQHHSTRATTTTTTAATAPPAALNSSSPPSGKNASSFAAGRRRGSAFPPSPSNNNSSNPKRSTRPAASSSSSVTTGSSSTNSTANSSSNNNNNSTKRPSSPVGTTLIARSPSSAKTPAAAAARTGTVTLTAVSSGVSPLTVSPDGFLAGGGAASGGVSSVGTGMDADVAVSVSGSEMNAGGLTPMAAVREGDKVRLKGSSPRLATVRFVGETQFASGVWVGVELDPGTEPRGNNDGTVRGVSYFACPALHGIFLRPDMVELEDEGPAEDERSLEAGTDVGGGTVSEADMEVARAEVERAWVENDRIQREQSEAREEARRAGAELLRCHKLFVNEALETLKDEMGVIPGLENLLDSDEPVPADRLRFYREVLESAADAREAAAARLRSQIRGATVKYASIFSDSIRDADDGNQEETRRISRGHQDSNGKDKGSISGGRMEGSLDGAVGGRREGTGWGPGLGREKRDGREQADASGYAEKVSVLPSPPAGEKQTGDGVAGSVGGVDNGGERAESGEEEVLVAASVEGADGGGGA